MTAKEEKINTGLTWVFLNMVMPLLPVFVRALLA